MKMNEFNYATGLVLFDPQLLASLYRAWALKVDSEGTIFAFTAVDGDWGWYDIGDLEPSNESKKTRTQ